MPAHKSFDIFGFMELNFTGEQFIPGKTSSRIADDHLSRYDFALQFVKNKKVLDIACGTGYGSHMLLEKGGAEEVDGIDISPDVIQYANDNYKVNGINFFADDLENNKINKKYDIITCFETIEHIKNHKKAINNLFGLLNDGGTLLISSPNRLITSPDLNSSAGKPKNPYHNREFTVDELTDELEKSGFEVLGAYGQRQQRYFKNRYLRRIYKYIFKPDKKFSAKPAKLYAEPRYFLLMAKKFALI